MLRSAAKAVRLEARGRGHALTLRRLGGGFGLRLALLARHGLFRIVARRALGEPGLDLVHIELQPLGVVLGQQRIEMAEPLDEAAVARKPRVSDDDVIDRALLGACASEADND